MRWQPENKDELYQTIKEIISNQLSDNNYTYGLRDIDVSLISDMSYLFSCNKFDKNSKINKRINWDDPRNDITQWNVSNVTNITHMFYDSSFNQDINSWDVSKVIDTYGILDYSEFNQPIEKWNINNVTDVNDMFASKPVTNMEGMFSNFIEKQKNDMELNDNKPINEQNSDLGYNENDILYISFKTLSKEEFNLYISSIDDETIISFAKDFNPKELIELVNKINNPDLKMEILKSKIDIDTNSKDDVKENLSKDEKVININVNLDLGDLDR